MRRGLFASEDRILRPRGRRRFGAAFRILRRCLPSQGSGPRRIFHPLAIDSVFLPSREEEAGDSAWLVRVFAGHLNSLNLETAAAQDEKGMRWEESCILWIE